MRVANEVLITAGDMSGTLTSVVFDITHLGLISVQAVYTGSPTGSLKLQASNNGTNWSDLGASYTQAISAAGNVIWNYVDAGFLQLRALYTFTSGTGSLTVTANGKGF